MKFEIDGLDKLQDELKSMQQAAEQMEKGEDVSFNVLFNEKFMNTHTNFKTFDELLSAGGFVVNSQDDFEAIPDKELDKHISKTTQFDSWQEMLDTAGTQYAAKKLGF